jgi:hypothetical protein
LSARNLVGANKTLEGLINSPIKKSPPIPKFLEVPVKPCDRPLILGAKEIAEISYLPDETLANWGQNGREAVRSSSDNYFKAWEALLWEVLAN